ncbi:MAG: DUF167 domain-containing protein [Acidimicrobiales bacterium]
MIRFTAYVHPGASSRRVGGAHGGALNVYVRAKAVAGAANDEALRALADAFDVKVRLVTCVRGARSRLKTIAIEGDSALLGDCLNVLLKRE